MAYASASSVAKLTKNILGPEKNFSFSTCPTSVEVNTWLSSGCSIIEGLIAGHKYNVPVASGTTIYGWLSDLNTLYGAAMVEMSRSNVVLSPGERTRGQYFYEIFWEQLDKLFTKTGDLTLAGLTRTSQGTLYAGGVYVSTKQAYEADSSITRGSFEKGLFRFPETLPPDRGRGYPSGSGVSG